MKLLLIAILMLLLFKTIKNTGITFSRELQKNEFTKTKEKYMDLISGYPSSASTYLNNILVIVASVVYILFAFMCIEIYKYVDEPIISILVLINLIQTIALDIPKMYKCIKSEFEIPKGFYLSRIYLAVNYIINISFYSLSIYYLFGTL